MISDLIYLFKTNEEWLILRNNTFSYRGLEKETVTCLYSSLIITPYFQNNNLIQLFIHIPALNKTIFLTHKKYPEIINLYFNLKLLYTDNKDFNQQYRKDL